MLLDSIDNFNKLTEKLDIEKLKTAITEFRKTVGLNFNYKEKFTAKKKNMMS